MNRRQVPCSGHGGVAHRCSAVTTADEWVVPPRRAAKQPPGCLGAGGFGGAASWRSSDRRGVGVVGEPTSRDMGAGLLPCLFPAWSVPPCLLPARSVAAPRPRRQIKGRHGIRSIQQRREKRERTVGEVDWTALLMDGLLPHCFLFLFSNHTMHGVLFACTRCNDVCSACWSGSKFSALYSRSDG